ncbi:UNVERIFIED_ORG: hypothetical protein ABIB52_000699 [Arthrobacter sp. UYCu721]
MFVPVWVHKDKQSHDGYHAIVNTREVTSVIATEWNGGYAELRAEVHLNDGRVLSVAVRGGQHSSEQFERAQWFRDFFREFEDAATGLPENPWKRWSDELKSEGHERSD